MFNILYECVKKKLLWAKPVYLLDWGPSSEKEKDDWWHGKETADAREVWEGGCFEGEGEG